MSENELEAAIITAREQLRRELLAAPMTDERDTYQDGYAQGLARAVEVIDRWAPSIRFIAAD